MTMTLDVVALTSSLDAAREARTAVRGALDDSPAETVDHACLLVDELVTHALAAAGAPLRLVLERHPGRLTVEVVDAGGHAVPPGPVADRVGIAGVMLDAWADDWGAFDQATGSSIWFSLACGPEPRGDG